MVWCAPKEHDRELKSPPQIHMFASGVDGHHKYHHHCTVKRQTMLYCFDIVVPYLANEGVNYCVVRPSAGCIRSWNHKCDTLH